MQSDPTNATLVHRHDLTPEVSIFRVRPDSGQVASFEPGQFATLGLPADPSPDDPPPKPGATRRVKLIRRAYSIASSADVRDHLEFYLVLVPDGRLTPKLFAMREGDRMFMDPVIRGEFTLEGIPADADLVCISTGTGLTPFISMLRTYRARGEKRWNKCVVIHGARLAADLGYREELTGIAQADPSVVYLPMVTREPEGSKWTGLRGRVTTIMEPDPFEKLTGVKLDPARLHVMLCGNPDMIEAIRKSLEARGFVTHTRRQAGNIHFERYW